MIHNNLSQNTQSRINYLDNFLQENWVDQQNISKTEHYLISQRSNPEHVITLFEFVQKGPESSKQLFISIELKNCILDQYQIYCDARRDLNDQFLNQLRQQILLVYFDPKMASTRPKIFSIISKTVKWLVDREFPENWSDLLDLIAGQCSPKNHEVNLLAFKLLKHITKKYPYKSPTEELKNEVGLVIGRFHDVVMEYCQGYLSMLEQDSIDVNLNLKLISLLLKIFADMLAQEMNETLEENFGNWMKVIKPIFAVEMNAKINFLKSKNQVINQKEVQQNPDDLWFVCKGEAIKILSLMGPRCEEECSNEMESFANDIWINCLEYASSGSRDKSKLLVNSLKYFKSLASAQRYFEFFEQNVADIIIKLVIPSLGGFEDDWQMFKKEPDTFVETSFVLQNIENKKKNIIHDFITTLTRFHKESVLSVVETMLKEILTARSLDRIWDEVLFLTIFYDAVVVSASDSGATSINCPLPFLQYVFENLIEGIVSQFADNSAAFEGGTLQKGIYLVSQYLRFIYLFQNYLGFERISNLVFKLFCNTISVPNLTYQSLLIEQVTRIFRTRVFIIEDNMNKPVEHLSFYQKYYNNPQKVLIRQIDGGVKFKVAQNTLCFEAVFKSFGWYYRNSILNVNPRSVRLFKTMIELIEESNWEMYACDVFDIVEFTLQSLHTKKLNLNFQTIDTFFEVVSLITIRAKGEYINRLKRIICFLVTLLSEQYLELNALVIQSVALFVRVFKVTLEEMNALNIKNLFANVLDPNSYTQSTIGIFFAQFYLIQEVLLVNPVLLNSGRMEISTVLSQANNLLQLRVTYDFLKFLAVNKLPMEGFWGFVTCGLDNYYKCVESQNEESKKFRFMKQTYIKEFLEFVLIYSAVNSFAGLVNVLNREGLRGQFRAILTSEDVCSFLSQNLSRPFRVFMLIRLARILFEEYEFFTRENWGSEYSRLLNCALENVWRMKFESRSLKNNYESRRMEIEKMDEITCSNYSNIYRLKAYVEIADEFIGVFRKQVDLKQTADVFFVESFRNFLSHQRLNAKDVVGDEKYLSLLQPVGLK